MMCPFALLFLSRLLKIEDRRNRSPLDFEKRTLMDETHQLRGLAGNKGLLGKHIFLELLLDGGVVFNFFGSNAMTAQPLIRRFFIFLCVWQGA